MINHSKPTHIVGEMDELLMKYRRDLQEHGRVLWEVSIFSCLFVLRMILNIFQLRDLTQSIGNLDFTMNGLGPMDVD